MSVINKVELEGRLGTEPKILKEGDRSFVQISFATNEYYKNAQGESCEDKQWHTVYFSGKAAKIAIQELHKGDKISLIGKLKYSLWTDETGKNRNKAGVYSNHYEYIKAASQK